MLDFRLHTFLILCETRSYTKTAELLHLTQPAVTQHIKYLESYYGEKLVDYRSRVLTVTGAGQRLRGFAMTMNASAERARILVGLKKGQLAPVQFGATLTIGEYTMPRILDQILLEFPDIRLSMQVANTHILLAKLESGEIDFALLEGFFERSEYSSYLFSLEPFCAVCSPSHRKAGEETLTLESLLDERLIVREEGSGTRDILEQTLYERNLSVRSFAGVTEVGNLQVIKHLVAENRGITFLYEEAVERELKSGSLCRLPLVDFSIEREFRFVFLKDSLHEEEFTGWFRYFREKNEDQNSGTSAL